MTMLGALIGSLLGVVAGWFLLAGKSAIENAAARGVNEWFDSARWSATLTRELEKIRGTERQELRFRAYGGLFKAMRPLAIYDENAIDQKSAITLRDSLSNWYFSELGGLLLTEQARDFYFTLQDVVGHAADVGGWIARRADDPETTVAALFARQDPPLEDVLADLDCIEGGEWPSAYDPEQTTDWRESVVALVERQWFDFDDAERYAILQVVSSRLRTVLTKDVDSRLR